MCRIVESKHELLAAKARKLKKALPPETKAALAALASKNASASNKTAVKGNSHVASKDNVRCGHSASKSSASHVSFSKSGKPQSSSKCSQGKSASTSNEKSQNDKVISSKSKV